MERTPLYTGFGALTVAIRFAHYDARDKARAQRDRSEARSFWVMLIGGSLLMSAPEIAVLMGWVSL
jgi:hypothetical protein